jgi:predicted ATPase
MEDETAYQPGNPALAASGLAFILTGCSGGGKSTLLQALVQRGYAVRPEAGRQIVREQMHLDGEGLPWRDAQKFVELAASRTLYLFNTTPLSSAPVFFDRALVDLTSFLEMKGIPVPAELTRAVQAYRYARTVFVTPPWRDIYVDDGERGKSFDAACREYDALVDGYRRAGYKLLEVPHGAVRARADFIVANCAPSPGGLRPGSG